MIPLYTLILGISSVAVSVIAYREANEDEQQIYALYQAALISICIFAGTLI